MTKPFFLAIRPDSRLAKMGTTPKELLPLTPAVNLSDMLGLQIAKHTTELTGG